MAHQEKIATASERFLFFITVFIFFTKTVKPSSSLSLLAKIHFN